ncbi:glycosyltransferase family 39 protein [Streptomyces pseudovenezuelae]|uniref:4-amino-4-deoxy-L-arabinose transferase-like glycosyltransferase n=1 Tax=Streptomyces pseudovenezuelae TaxID=67350 RepID=A0ABT6LSM7_9ACTN|nr:glycosyltransferase family 39 protein [Streptomyces pseudovenezuelae]MDH6219252.1 4-amino-4-deoxy-L-arabinose transferase-like glycosyltransferase [Streptomyces pseudovenezuelae]
MTTLNPSVLEGPVPPRTAAVTGRADSPPWERPAFWALLIVAAVAFFWDLGASGYGNEFYSAAVQAGGESWKAAFFGASDAGNSITVDKPPVALWPMDLSVRLFGVGSWQILAPEALMGVATVGVLYAAVRRLYGPAAGLLAGALLALTPVAALMFRFNNPDALLALLMVCALYCFQRALEGHRAARWMVLTGVCFGLAFLVKTLQAWLILPALTLVYLVCAALPLTRRIGHVLLAGAAIVASAGWWVALVELWPADSRPYVGGSTNNSFLDLTLGYNGLGRITGDESKGGPSGGSSVPSGVPGGGSVPGGGGAGGGGAGGHGGEGGITRMFDSALGGQISWLLPAALILLVTALVITRRAARTDLHRAGVLAWGGALVCTAVTFSLMSGIFHEYYTVALAPYVAALVAMGTVLLWRLRDRAVPAVVLAVTVAATAAWAFVLLGRADGWTSQLRWPVLVVGVLAAAGTALARLLPRRLALGATGLALAAVLAGPASYTWATVTMAHTGQTPLAGPASTADAQGHGGPTGGAAAGAGKGGGNRLGGVEAVTPQLRSVLVENAQDYTWVAATVASDNQTWLQLATGEPVMPIGGFSGGDPAPTLARFKQYVADGEIHYFVAQGGEEGGFARDGADTTGSRISSWVTTTFTPRTVGSTVVYDLSAPTS